MQNLRYPIGNFKSTELFTGGDIMKWTEDIKAFPEKLKTLVQDLRLDQLRWTYRPGGWTIQQVVHHCADSHMNSFIRFKLALTEDAPTIKPYLEHLWAEMPDANYTDINTSLGILDGLHKRWGILLDNLGTQELKKVFIHPEHGKRFTIIDAMDLYAWHCNHHLAHVEQAIRFKGNFGNLEDDNLEVA